MDDDTIAIICAVFLLVLFCGILYDGWLRPDEITNETVRSIFTNRNHIVVVTESDKVIQMDSYLDASKITVGSTYTFKINNASFSTSVGELYTPQ